MNPIVSIIIPVYNKKEYIRTCLDSLLDQDYTEYEIIVIDDGSTDGSGELLDMIYEEKKYDKIRIFHQKNQGVAAARNKGMQLAKGEWIWFVDADDLPSSRWLNEIRYYFENGEYDIIFSNYVNFFSNGQEEITEIPAEGNIDGEKLARLFMEEQYKTGYFGYLWCKLLKKSFIKKCNASFVPGLTLAEDLKFLISLYENSPKCYFAGKQAYRYTVEANNSSKEKKIDYVAQLEIHYSIFLWIKETDYFREYERVLKKHISYYVAFVFFYGYEDNNTLRKEITWWKKNTKYLECLESRDMSGIMKLIVIFLKWGKINSIKKVLRMREFIRGIYRGVKLNEVHII